MKHYLYIAGRTLQLAALIILPFASWVAEFEHDEAGSITIFGGAIALFFLGWLLSKR